MRIKSYRLVEILDGAVVILLGVVRDAAAREGDGILRIKPYGLVEIRDSTVVLIFFVVGIAAVVEGYGQILPYDTS